MYKVSFFVSETVLIAKMDGTENDLENVQINGFPTLKIFKKDTNEIVDYNGNFLRLSILKSKDNYRS